MAAKKAGARAKRSAQAKRTESKPTRRSIKKVPLTQKISSSDLKNMLMDIDVPDEELAKYFQIAEGQGLGFTPQVVINEALVEQDGLEAAGFLNLANSIARWRRNRIYKRRIKNWTGIKIVAEGDSWFQYPLILKDTIDQLNDLEQFNYAIYGLSEAGDLLGNMVKEDELTAAIEKHSPHVVLLSGGGNDMVGNERLATLVKPYRKGRPANEYLNDKFDQFVDQIEELYRGLFERLVSIYPHLKVVCHGYDRAIPDKGPWLGKPLESVGIRNAKLQARIVVEMIDRFNVMLAKIAQRYAGRVYYVDCRDLIGSQNNWHDELHPKNDGYLRVAERFDETIKRALAEPAGPERLTNEAVGIAIDRGSSSGMMSNPTQLSNEEFESLVTKRARVRLSGAVAPPIDESERRGLEVQLEKVHLIEDFLPSSFLERGVERSHAVCRIRIRSALGRGYGTGFLIGTRDYIMTNNHVLPDVETAASSTAEFDYDQDSIEYDVKLRPERFFVSNEQLDFTIVACDSFSLPAEIVPIDFPVDPHTVTRKERVNIIQHPNGRRKEVSLHNNEVMYVYQEVIRYRTDTDAGSSGSPVCNNEWVLCGLHHAGVRNADGRAVNEGIKISAIHDFLRSLNRDDVNDVLGRLLQGNAERVENVVENGNATKVPSRSDGQRCNPGKGVTININQEGPVTINV